MLHADVNVFHCVVCVGIVEDEGLLDLLVMMGEFLDLGAVALDRSLNKIVNILISRANSNGTYRHHL